MTVLETGISVAIWQVLSRDAFYHSCHFVYTVTLSIVKPGDSVIKSLG